MVYGMLSHAHTSAVAVCQKILWRSPWRNATDFTDIRSPTFITLVTEVLKKNSFIESLVWRHPSRRRISSMYTQGRPTRVRRRHLCHSHENGLTHHVSLHSGHSWLSLHSRNLLLALALALAAHRTVSFLPLFLHRKWRLKKHCCKCVQCVQILIRKIRERIRNPSS